MSRAQGAKPRPCPPLRDEARLRGRCPPLPHPLRLQGWFGSSVSLKWLNSKMDGTLGAFVIAFAVYDNFHVYKPL